MQTSDELRIGIIGAGGRGRIAYPTHRPEDGQRIVGGVDINPETLAKFKEEFGDDVLTTDNYLEMLDRDDINVVFVTSPDFLHEEHAVAALERGKAVYLEKPMAITVEGCDRILKAACDNNAKLYVGHNMRHMAMVRKMKDLIATGAIGEVKTAWCRHFVCYGGDAYFKDWHAERSKATSLLLQKAAHDIDVLHWLCSGYTTRTNALGALMVYDKITDRHPPEEYGDSTFVMENWPPLSQKGMNPVIDVEDVSMMNMQLDNGVLACYQQCHFTPDGWRNYTVIGTEGRVENFGDGPGNCVVRLWNRRAHYNPYGDEQYYIPPATGGHGGSDTSIIGEFLDFVRSGIKITTSAVAARECVAAGCAAAESLRNGGVPVDIPKLPADLIAHFAGQVADGR